MTGVLNVYKEKGYTSHDVVAIIRKLTARTVKVGHTGTLDPDATGVLPICLGSATKFTNHLTSADKTYIAEVILGIETTTGDISGDVVATAVVNFCEETIVKVVNSFGFEKRGEYKQTPPMFSAIKIGGKKLYELAHKGETIDRPVRSVTINKIQVLNFVPEKNAFTIEVNCSKGTYIRSLAMDIGSEIGCGATMGELERVQSGVFDINSALKLEEIKKAVQDERLAELIIPIDTLFPYSKINVTGDDLKLAANGNPLPLLKNQTEKKYWVCDKEKIIGLFASDSKKLRSEVML